MRKSAFSRGHKFRRYLPESPTDHRKSAGIARTRGVECLEPQSGSIEGYEGSITIGAAKILASNRSMSVINMTNTTGNPSMIAMNERSQAAHNVTALP